MQRFLAKQARQPSGFFGRHVATRIFRKTNRVMEDRIMEHLQPSPGDRLLEIGFGAGRLLELLAPQVPQGKMAGIEISGDMYQKVRKTNQQLINQGMIELKIAGISSIPYRNNYFDGVVTANTVYFWPKPENDILEALRVLKPGAVFICGFRPEDQMRDQSVMGKNRDIFRHLYSPEKMQTFLSDAGFEAVSTAYFNDRPLDTIIASGRKPE